MSANACRHPDLGLSGGAGAPTFDGLAFTQGRQGCCQRLHYLALLPRARSLGLNVRTSAGSWGGS